MAVIKCKMCGGDLVLIEGQSVAECEYCGTRQTVPAADNDKKLALFARAGRLRAACEFDKAAGIYETIVADFPEEAESYWGLVLCKYGIEYVTDPATGRKVPTCHRSSFDSILQDSDFEQAMENADTAARRVYREEAKQLENIRRGIIAVSSNEQPYDIFICYKETDENGQRTLDSVLAQDIYDALTAKDYRIFFSRITLEEKLGVEYEPYIFAALNSAKVMIAVGTDYEYFNAVWVKNEWSRFLKLMAQDKSKHLIPCFKGIDAYDMPAEFARLQAQDLGKVGAVQDLIRGIEKLIPRQKAEKIVQERVIYESSNNKVASLLDRGFMALEDGEWERADNFFEEALNNDSKNPMGYLGKLMAELRVSKQEALKDCAEPFDNSNNYSKIIRFADDALREELTGYIAQINERKELARLEKLYQSARRELERANSEAQYKAAAKRFAAINGYKDSAAFEKRCLEKAEVARLDVLYAAAKALMTGSKISNYQEAIQRFEVLADWRDSSEQIEICQRKIAEIEEQKARKVQKAQKPPKEPKAAKEQSVYYNRKKRKLPLIAAAIVCVAIAVTVIVSTARPKDGISEPADRMDAAQPTEATAAIEATEDSQTALLEAKYRDAVAQKDAGNLLAAIRSFTELGDYSDAKAQADNLRKLYQKPLQPDSIGFSGGAYYGRKNDGTLRLAAGHQFGQFVYDWENIIAVDATGHIVGLKQDGTVVVAGSNESGECNVSDWTDIVAIEAGGFNPIGINKLYTVGLKADGTVVAVGYNEYGQCDVSDWTDIIAIRARRSATYGLKSDGTVVAVGYNENGTCDVSDWTDIVEIIAPTYDFSGIIGLKADGSVVASGYNTDLSDWTDIVAISAPYYEIVGLKSDGTVVATGRNEYGQCDVSGWTDIVAICDTGSCIAGLKADGTVVVAGDNSRGQFNASTWTDVVAVKAGVGDLYGLKSDGTVVTTADSLNLSGLTDIVDFYPINKGIFGLKADGSTIFTEDINSTVKSVISGWTDIKVPDRAKLPSGGQNSKTVPLEAAKVGDYVVFGAYEQDNDTSNGKEKIEWQVLDKQDNKLLVISKFALDCKPYNPGFTDTTWETCSLRSWLNADFLNGAFTVEERTRIPTVTVEAHKNPKYSTNPGNATRDQVFLLSIQEADIYFTSDSAMQCQPTAYAVTCGAWESSSGSCCWWIRSPGSDRFSAAFIDTRAGIYEAGDYAYGSTKAVRPALWIDLNA